MLNFELMFQRSLFRFLLPVYCLMFISACRPAKQITRTPQQEFVLPEIKIAAQRTYKGIEKKDFDILHMSLSVRPDWKKRQLEGKAILTVTPHAYRQDTLMLDAKGFEINSVVI